VRRLAGYALRGAGYTVLEASGASEAFRVLEGHQGPIQLLVTDVVMPELGGRQVAEKLLGAHPEMKVLYVSGYTDDAIIRHGVLEAEANFLQKPFLPATLLQKVREVLDAS
jgi:CheY-like chemotaxis protein